MQKKLSYEYIRGLVEGEGCFTFHTGAYKKSTGRKIRIPAFVIIMHIRDIRLIELIKYTLDLRNKIYIRTPTSRDGYNRGLTAMLAIRDYDQIEKIIIPCFYNKLRGNKGAQFIEWIENIGKNPDVSEKFKSIYKHYKLGKYDSSESLKAFL